MSTHIYCLPIISLLIINEAKLLSDKIDRLEKKDETNNTKPEKTSEELVEMLDDENVEPEENKKSVK